MTIAEEWMLRMGAFHTKFASTVALLCLGLRSWLVLQNSTNSLPVTFHVGQGRRAFFARWLARLVWVLE